MKLLDDLTSNYYECEIFKIPKKLVISSIVIFIIVFILVIVKLPFSIYLSYYISKNDNNYYVQVPYDEIDTWLDKKELRYNGKNYIYKICDIGDENIIKNNKVYLQLKLEVKQIDSPLNLIKIDLEKDNITIIRYFKQQLRR